MSAGSADQLIASTAQVEGVFEEALKIFIERNKVRGDLWRTAGANSHLEQMKSKLKRTMLAKDHSYEELRDDALDLLVYTTFFIVKADADEWEDDEL